MVCTYGTSREETQHRQPVSKLEVYLAWVGIFEIILHVVCIVVSLELRVSHCCYVYYTVLKRSVHMEILEFPMYGHVWFQNNTHAYMTITELMAHCTCG